MAFHSMIDVASGALQRGGRCSAAAIWALVLTRTHFSVSAAVGFISIFGVAIMDGAAAGVLLQSAAARRRALGRSLIEGGRQRLRPMMMTALTAIFGLLPAALSTRIGAQTQQPLAIVVIGGMIMALFLNRYLTPVLYSVLRRRPPRDEAAAWGEVE